FRSDGLEKYLRAQTVRAPVLWFNRLVDDIPAVDPAAVPARQLSDMVDDCALLRLSVGQVEIPVRGTVVPQQIVAAQDEVIGACEVCDGVGGCIVIVAGGAPVHDLPFHLVLGNHDASLLAYKSGKRAIAGNLRCCDRSPVKEAFFRCQLAERRGLYRPAERRS